MPNEKSKKVIDYSEFFEKEKKEEKKPVSQRKYKIFNIFNYLKDFWFRTEKKTKIELIILLVIIVLIIIVLIFYLSQPKTSELLPPLSPAEY